MDDPNAWTASELATIISFSSLLLYCLLCSSWLAFRSRSYPWFWRACATSIWCGIGLLILAVRVDSGVVMPLAFAAGTWLLLAGMAAASTRSAAALCMYLLKRGGAQYSG
ncbi:putative membrane protein [Collimonas fungivorans]|uniref:Putative membrane protein n=1 Tax=Collimonas fungivorans TaxID=158899 RepID=A0A127PIU2_9BURK|nr:hypothetical protein [Collimonas fungivorans]AMO97732.1 putative membrane protein [Collimonas fungivorans]